MNMQIQVSDQTFKRLRHASLEIGAREEFLVQRAISYYLDAIQNQIELAEEFDAWERLSDEALMNFEAAL